MSADLTLIMKDCKLQMQNIIAKGGSPFCARYLGAKFNYFYALAVRGNLVQKRFDDLKEMYQDYHRQAQIEGWQPVKIAKFE